jgi:hypothetical protein
MKNEIKYAHGGNVFKNEDTQVTYFVEQHPDGVWTIFSEGPQWSRRDEYEYGFASESDAIDIAKIEAGITHEEDPEAYFFRKTEYAKGGNTNKDMDIQNKIDKLKKVYNSTLVPESVKVKALAEIEKLKKQNVNQTKTSVKEVKSKEIGMDSDQREFNKTVLQIIEKNKIYDANSFEQIVSEVLQDSNFHTEAFIFASILDKSIVTKQDWYSSGRFVADDKTRTIALEISNMAGWDASKFGPALEFTLRMKGFSNIADALKKSLQEEESEYPNAIEELTKRQTEYTQEIATRTGLRQSAVADFVAKNGLTESQTLNLLQGLGMGKIIAADFMTAVVGIPGNSFEKRIIAFAKSNEAFKSPTPTPTPPPTPKVDESPIVKDDRLGNKKISEVATYVAHRNIKSIVIEFNGKEITLNGSDIFDGIYVDNKIVGVKTRKKREPKVARTQFEEETFEFAKGGYTRPAYDLKITGDYEFSTNYGLNYQFSVRGFEREGDVTDSLYFDNSETTAKRELGSIIIKNSAWKNLSNGKTIMAVSSTGIKGKLTKLTKKMSIGGEVNDIKNGEVFQNTENGNLFEISIKTNTSNFGDNEKYYVLKSIPNNPNELPDVLTIREFERFLKAGHFKKQDKQNLKMSGWKHKTKKTIH